MSEIIAFPGTLEPAALEPRIWICRCGCSSFNLREDGSTVCALCSLVDDAHGGWTRLGEEQEYTGDVEPISCVQGNGDVEFARRVVTKRAYEPDAVSIIVIREGGSIHVWTGAETREQAEWVQRRITDAVELAKWTENE